MTPDDVALALGIKRADSVSNVAAEYRRTSGAELRTERLPGKGRPMIYKRADVYAWVEYRRAHPKSGQRVAPPPQSGNAQAGKVIELPQLQVGDVVHVPGRNQRGVVVERKPNGALPASGGHSMHVAISDEHWALLERLAATGLYGITDPDALAHRFMLDELRRHIHVPQTYQRAVRG